MSVIIMANEMKSLEKEPYVSFAKEFDKIKDEPVGKTIELDLKTDGKEGFVNGFYADEYIFQKNLRARFSFMKPDNTNEVFIRMHYYFEYGRETSEHQIEKATLIKKRAPYFYIQGLSHLDLNIQIIDDYFNLYLDVGLKDESDIEQVCFSLLNQLISIFSYED